jgi:hypothetical protein
VLTDTLAAFRWKTPDKGFHWAEGDDDFVLFPCEVASDQLVVIDGVRDLLPSRDYHPLADDSALFRNFAAIGLDLDAILAFARTHGALTRDGFSALAIKHRSNPRFGKSTCKGETFGFWRTSVREIRNAIEIWDAIRTENTELLGRHFLWRTDGEGNGVYFSSLPDRSPSEVEALAIEFGEVEYFAIATDQLNKTLLSRFTVGDVIAPALWYLQRKIKAKLEKNLSGEVDWNYASKRMTFGMIPNDLLGAVWLQFAVGIDAALEYRSCKTCKKWYALTPEVARKTRQFCSNACKIRDYRSKQDEARRLVAAGKKYREIAKRLGSSVAIVRGWVVGRGKVQSGGWEGM